MIPNNDININNIDLAYQMEIEQLERDCDLLHDGNHLLNNDILNSTNGSSINDTNSFLNSILVNHKGYDDLKDFLNSISTDQLSFQSKNKLIKALDKVNKHIASLDKDIKILIEAIRQIYKAKYPDLLTIVTNPYFYVKTVQIIEKENKLDDSSLSFLPKSVYISLKTTFEIIKSKQLHLDRKKKNELLFIIEHCLQLYNYQQDLSQFSAKKMKTIAPNLTELLGADIAGKLVTSAGGITELAKTPSGNILNMGNHIENYEGFASNNKLNNGYLTELEEYKTSSENMKIKVLRRYSNKAVLAARIDAFKILSEKDDIPINDDEHKNKQDEMNEVIPNTYGKRLKEIIGEKIDKIINNKQPILKKPLPRPDDKPRRKRGGKRARGLKKRYEQTEIRLLKNRMKFGPEGEMEFRDTGEGFGMLKANGIGSRIKTTKDTSQKIVTKKQKLYDMQYSSNKNETSIGIQSSIVMTPKEGIELINPLIFKNQVPQIKQKYFDNSSGFTTVIKNRLNEF